MLKIRIRNIYNFTLKIALYRSIQNDINSQSFQHFNFITTSLQWAIFHRQKHQHKYHFMLQLYQVSLCRKSVLIKLSGYPTYVHSQTAHDPHDLNMNFGSSENDIKQIQGG